MNIKTIAVWFVLCASLVSVTTGCGDDHERAAARHLKAGNALLQQGLADKARERFKAAATIKPTDADIAYHIGLADEELGDLRSAFNNFSVAESMDSNHLDAKLKVAQFQIAAEQIDQAKKRIDSVLIDNPKYADAHALLSALLVREKKFDEAEKMAQTALSFDKNNVLAISALAGAYSAKDQMPKAFETINNAIKLNPDRLPLHLLRLKMYGKARDIPKIAEGYREIFKIRPKTAKYRFHLANIFLKADMLDQAEAVLREAIGDIPDDPDLRRELVFFLNDYRKLSLAESEVEKMIKANPSDDDPLFWLADIYLKAKNTDKAISVFNKILSGSSSGSSASQANAMLAKISMNEGNKDVAREIVTAILNKDPKSLNALIVKAQIEFQDRQYDKAIEVLQKILTQDKKNVEAIKLMAEAYLAQNREEQALETMQKLIEIDAKDLTTRVRIAQILGSIGNTRQAMEQITLITNAVPDNAYAWETAARIAIEGKEWLPAKEAVKKLRKLEGQQTIAALLDGEIFYRNNRYADAISKFTEVIKTDPATPAGEAALRMFVLASHKDDQLKEASIFLRDLKKRSPLVDVLLGKCYIMIDKKLEAIRAYEKAIDAKTTIPDAYVDRANLYFADKKHTEALAVLEQGEALIPNDAYILKAKGALLLSMEKYAESLPVYHALIALDPKDDEAANNLAALISDYSYEIPEELEKAKDLAERFADSTDVTQMDTLAWVYYRMGKFAQAKTIMERAIKGKNNLPAQVHYHYGAILLKTGQPEKAKEHLKKATARGENYPGIDDARKLLKGN